MKIFKKRQVEQEKLEKSLTIFDSETNEVKEIIDILDEEKAPKELSLKDEESVVEYTEEQVKDMTFMQTLRDAYPDMKDMEKFLTDACLETKGKDLTDAELALEKEKLAKLAEADALTEKMLKDKALEDAKTEKDRQDEIVEAERKRHADAQKK